MIYFSLVHWQIRNEWVHDEKKKENINEKEKKINDAITERFKKRNEFDKDSEYLFRESLLSRCMKPMRNKEAWLRTIELEYKITKGEIT